PFIWRQMMMSSSLRRQSRPLARMIRDFIFLKRPLLSLIVGSTVVFSIFMISQDNTSHHSPDIHPQERITPGG
ncbi:MAG: hypothetical protein ACKO2Z_08545, partial [Sphaerospermopsis kisseleviana]